MSTRTYELTVPVRKGERGMGIVVNPENCVIELAELAARQSQKEVEAAALEQANRDWEGGRK